MERTIPRKELLVEWYATLRPLNIDIVGDFAGQGLFAVHGESLIRHCLNSSESKLDFKDGFQLLHAVYVVELFLSNLYRRDCNFDVIFFDSLAQTCVPRESREEDAHKYLLTRSILIRHLSRSSPSPKDSKPRPRVLKFASPQDSKLQEHLAKHTVHFFMCHDGDDDLKDDTLALKHLIHTVLNEWGNVALIQFVKWQSSRVFAPIVSSQVPTMQALRNMEFTSMAQYLPAEHIERIVHHVEPSRLSELSIREQITLQIGTAIRNCFPDQDIGAKSRLHGLILHLATLKSTSLQGRQRNPEPPLHQPNGSVDATTVTWDETTACSYDKGTHGAQWQGPSRNSQTKSLPGAVLDSVKAGSEHVGTQVADPDSADSAGLHSALKNTVSGIDHLNDVAYIKTFSQAARAFIDGDAFELFKEGSSVEDDSYDLIDGRIFFETMKNLRFQRPFSQSVVDNARRYIKMINISSDQDQPCFEVAPYAPPEKMTENTTKPTVLRFSHPVVDKFLQNVQVEEVAETTGARANKIFQDLHHWHNSRRLVDSLPLKPHWKDERKRQRRMADIRSYAESLTNSIGKGSTAEPIISRSKKPESQVKRAAKQSQKPTQEPLKNTKNKKSSIKPGGRDAALAEAKKVQESKVQAKANDLVENWQNQVVEFQKIKDLVDCYLKAERYYAIMASKNQVAALGAEIQLFLCHVLGQIWKSARDSFPKKPREGLYLIAMAFQWLLQCSKVESPPGITKSLKAVSKVMKIDWLEFPSAKMDRGLCFDFDFHALRSVFKVVKDYRILQLEHGGPYLERAFDSKPDDRVPFDPDAWQREVLDSIDANNSQLVIAPTSAGKTFISFYAMKKVLQEDDDGVLVYVAPTKALVNQIAAEIEARFSKNYHGKAKSIWAIHTRDYRINSPHNCQVLVTVPHVLQIMLLSPPNSINSNSWSNRVKRIIFDEVHCIGQNDDGIVWEQLLLQSPCPITALSATVGNPEEFRDWLKLSQERKGHQVDLIIHNVRYSELRKFIYEPKEPQDVHFKGLNKAPRLPVPGLDEGNQPCSRLRFLHPIISLSQRNREALGGISFESRDCLTLFQEMQRILPDDRNEGLDELNPATIFPNVVTKAHVVEWEAQLKEVLKEALRQGGPALQQLKSRFNSVPSDVSTFDHIKTLFRLVCDLYRQGALPALVFNYDRLGCEKAAQEVLQQLKHHEGIYKESLAWLQKIQEYDEYIRQKSHQPKEVKIGHETSKKKKNRAEEPDKSITRNVVAQQKASQPVSIWESFDPDAPLEQYSFADHTKLQPSEFEEFLKGLRFEMLQDWQIEALRRGIGVHHAGMNRRYRQVVEMLFRRGYLRLVIATGTLALGINMPCKTVIFSGDSLYLTAQNYRQASGRAGRRGFDLLGNVVFNGIPRGRVYDIMSSRLPDLKGQFPISTSLILRCMTLLHGTRNSAFAVRSVESLLSQTRLYLGGPESEDSITHHLRFSIEYLRRQDLLSAEGQPLNFSGLISHLYFTENSVFAFHSLLKGGYFHSLCSNVNKNPEQVCLELMLVLSHIFGRIFIRDTQGRIEQAHRSSSIVFLPELPAKAATLLLAHNKETLGIFKRYVHSYISHNLEAVPDNTLPFTKVAVSNGASKNISAPLAKIRSPFVALSRADDEMESIHELCHTVRGGVFLEESAIPHIPIWPYDTKSRLNAYLYDFYKHGEMQTLVKDNGIKGGDVWQYLKDFDLVMSAIVASLDGYIRGEEEGTNELDLEDQPENWDEAAADMKMEKHEEDMLRARPALKSEEFGERGQEAVVDDWEGATSDASDDNMSDERKPSFGSNKESSGTMPAWKDEKGGLNNVLRAFRLLKGEFHEKFVKVWA